MKKPYYLTLLCAFLLHSCCFKKGEEIARITFTNQEKALIPYQNAALIDFVTNEDFEFQFLASENTWLSDDQDECEDYTSYEQYRVDLNAEIPNLNIELRLNRRSLGEDPPSITITVNRIPFSYEEASPETLEIDGVLYENVLRYLATQEESPITTMFFNNTNGILKIEYSNGDYVQIN